MKQMNELCFRMQEGEENNLLAQSAGAVEYSDCTSAEG